MYLGAGSNYFMTICEGGKNTSHEIQQVSSGKLNSSASISFSQKQKFRSTEGAPQYMYVLPKMALPLEMCYYMKFQSQSTYD